jgi:hypothetical protein
VITVKSYVGKTKAIYNWINSEEPSTEDGVQNLASRSEGDSIDHLSETVEPVETEDTIKQGYPALAFRFRVLSAWMLILTLAL